MIALAGVVLELVGSVRTPIQAPVATPVPHATPITSAQTCRSQPQPDDFAEALTLDPWRVDAITAAALVLLHLQRPTR